MENITNHFFEDVATQLLSAGSAPDSIGIANSRKSLPFFSDNLEEFNNEVQLKEVPFRKQRRRRRQ